MRFLIDSSILAQIFNRGDNALRCQQWLKEHKELYTSVVAILEIESGLIHGKMLKSLALFGRFIEGAPVKVLDVNREIASIAASKRAEALMNGQTLHPQDLLIGATAVYHGLKIVTANEKDFQCWGELENPTKPI